MYDIPITLRASNVEPPYLSIGPERSTLGIWYAFLCTVYRTRGRGTFRPTFGPVTLNHTSVFFLYTTVAPHHAIHLYQFLRISRWQISDFPTFWHAQILAIPAIPARQYSLCWFKTDWTSLVGFQTSTFVAFDEDHPKSISSCWFHPPSFSLFGCQNHQNHQTIHILLRWTSMNQLRTGFQEGIPMGFEMFWMVLTDSRIAEQIWLHTWWLIPLSKWVITPIISGLTLLIPFITGVITHLLSGMSHQVPLHSRTPSVMLVLFPT